MNYQSKSKTINWVLIAVMVVKEISRSENGELGVVRRGV